MYEHMKTGAMSVDEMEAHPMVRVARSGSWLDAERSSDQ